MLNHISRFHIKTYCVADAQGLPGPSGAPGEAGKPGDQVSDFLFQFVLSNYLGLPWVYRNSDVDATL